MSVLHRWRMKRVAAQTRFYESLLQQAPPCPECGSDEFEELMQPNKPLGVRCLSCGVERLLDPHTRAFHRRDWQVIQHER